MSPLPRFLALWTNSKKPRYKGKCSWEIPRCGRSQERSKDQNPSIVRKDTKDHEIIIPTQEESFRVRSCVMI